MTKLYLIPTSHTVTLTKSQIRDILNVDHISDQVFNTFKKGGIICNSRANPKRTGWIENDEDGIDWLEGNGYVEAFAPEEEIMI